MSLEKDLKVWGERDIYFSLCSDVFALCKNYCWDLKKKMLETEVVRLQTKQAFWGRSPGSHNGCSRSLTSYNVEALPVLVRQMCPHTLHARTLYWPLTLQFSREPFLSWEGDRHNLYLVLLNKKIWYWEASFKVDFSNGSCRNTVYKLEACFETEGFFCRLGSLLRR